MPARLAKIWLTMMLLVGISSPAPRAQETNPQNASLKGISGVLVLVENLPDSAKSLGLTEGMIQTDVELKLRLAGMRVVTTRQEDFELPGSPYLYVNVEVSTNAKAVHLEVELRQAVRLERNGELEAGASTWDAGGLATDPSAPFIRDRIKDEVDKFLNDWLSVNPKK